MDKQHIIDEIRRTAEENQGVPLGRQRFELVTGIKQSDWAAKHWTTWGEAVREAGFEPNKLATAYAEEYLFEKLVELIREIGRLPLEAELRMKARSDPGFPSHTVFRRLGRKGERARKLIEYCESRTGLEDVIQACRAAAKPKPSREPSVEEAAVTFGYVYLLRSGKFYKIGKTNSVGRREYELAIQLPEEATVIHRIKTDDPSGIETYWHQRFAAKRKGGEWFSLTQQDVTAFKRRNFM